VSDPTPFPRAFDPVDLDAWRAQVLSDLGDDALEKRLSTRLLEGFAVPPLHERVSDATPSEAAALLAGRPPGWSRWVEIHDPDPGASNADLRHDLGFGAHGAWIRFDRAVRTGGGGAGDGIRGADLDALRTLLDRVDLATTAIVLDAGAGAADATATYTALAAEHGVDPLALRGCRGHDPLGSLARDGVLPRSLDHMLDELGRAAALAHLETPAFAAGLVATSTYHDAGAHAAQEIAFAAATGLVYLRAMNAAGLTLDDAVDQLLFSVAVSDELFLEVSKLRAMRLVWAKVLTTLDAADPARMTLHARGSRRTKTRRDPWVNLLRGTVEATAAATGGADAITVLGYDDAVGPAEARARRLAVNTQVLLEEEAHLGKVGDPAAGSALVEDLTDRLARDAWALLQSIEADGGMGPSLTSGRIATDVARVADLRRRQVATRRRPVTGVSEFALADEPTLERTRPEWSRLRADASAGEPAGEKDPEGGVRVDPLAPLRLAGPYERIRDQVDAHTSATGKRPAVFLALLGSVPRHKARAGFAENLYRAGGLEPVAGPIEADPADTAAAVRDAGTRVAVICGDDADYADGVPAMAAALRDAGATDVVVAGRPGDHEQAWREAGVTRFIHLGCDVVQTLQETLRTLEVTR